MKSHVNVVKRIIMYVNGISDLEIWYTNDTNLNLACYCDTEWAGNADNRKGTSGGCFYLGNNMNSWHSKKQNSVSLSIAEAEYLATGSCCT